MTFSWVSKLPVEGVWSQVFYTPDVHIQQCSCSEDSLALQLVPVHNDDGKTTFKHLICCIFI